MLGTSSSSAARSISFILLSLLLAVNFTCVAVILTKEQRSNLSTRGSHTYIGDDYPRTWDIGELDTVLASSEPDAHRYLIHGADADAQWAAMTPGDGFIYLGERRAQFSFSMFHQLRCLGVLRDQLLQEEGTPLTELSGHCLNYLRQMVLCRADIALIPLQLIALYPDVLQCKDWRRVYAAVRENQEDHRRWLSE
ncbi:hypothetical protein BV25DRAFT_1831699 [Artomyces pyxidatus]|uniref:Uncharacterized protein n=1 Tax=Artomyces pyxidatus TaxID=48021 RepID=A0ACB8SKY8_9AGAM|nr:hypothetical protein BV25DRAFT_1831699 [Artomyces pyxidatus]